MTDSSLPQAEFHVLLALVDGAKHGHGVRVDIRKRTAGRVDMGPGTLYGAIKRLVRRGWIAEVEPPRGETDDGRRRFYELTAEGKAAARAEVTRLRELLTIAEAKHLRPATGTKP